MFQPLIVLLTVFFTPLCVAIAGCFSMVFLLVLIAHATDAPLPQPLPRATAGTLLNGPEEL